jgi:hypothetical protein
MELSPHWSGLPIGSPHQNYQKKQDPHLHTGDRYKSKVPNVIQASEIHRKINKFYKNMKPPLIFE